MEERAPGRVRARPPRATRPLLALGLLCVTVGRAGQLPCPCPSQKHCAFPTFSSDGQFPGFSLMRLGAILGNFINIVGGGFFFLSLFLA